MAQLDQRPTAVEEPWKTDAHLQKALTALSAALRDNLGWDARRLAGDDPMGVLLIEEDGLEMVELLMDLEDALGPQFDSNQFGEQMHRFTFRQAVEWLASRT